MAKRGPRRQGEHGAAAVEFALILPLFLVLILGIIDFGRLFYCEVTLNSAAREAARAVALRVTAVDGTACTGGADKAAVAADCASKFAVKASGGLVGMSLSSQAMTSTIQTVSLVKKDCTVAASAAAGATPDDYSGVTLTKEFMWLMPFLGNTACSNASTTPFASGKTSTGCTTLSAYGSMLCS